MARREGTFRVGTSGWQYEHWKGVFYPEKLRKSDWFEYYASHFDTVEVNNTFYHLPSARAFGDWEKAAPRGFLYALKFSRYGSHLKKLKDPRASIGMFLDRAKILGQFLGPILVQLPPHWKKDTVRLEEFLGAAPKSIRWACEFRDASWLCEEIFEVLRRHTAALCIHDLVEDHPYVVTTDWVYLRFHGAGNWGNYSHQKLFATARRIRQNCKDGLDVYAYFNNDAQGYAISNAQDLRRYVIRG